MNSKTWGRNIWKKPSNKSKMSIYAIRTSYKCRAALKTGKIFKKIKKNHDI